MPRQLTFFDGVCIIVGIIIGSGIFSSPGLALQRAGSPSTTLFAWTTASILVGLTCQCYFELGCMMPTAGGDYDYLHHTYGNRVAFSFAWFNFFISKPGSQAIIATIFGHYFETVITGQSNSISSSSSSSSSSQDQNTTLSKVISILLIIIITLINCIGIRESANFQNLMTCTKLGLVGILLLTAIVYASYYPSMITENLSVSNSFIGSNGIFSFGSALIACLWSFDGWADIIFLLEDLQNPYKQFPRIVLTSLTIVTIAYMLMNIAYFSVLSVEEIKSSPAIAVQLGSVVSQSMPSLAFMPTFFALGVALSAGGSCHGSIMAGGKALFAVARYVYVYIYNDLLLFYNFSLMYDTTTTM